MMNLTFGEQVKVILSRKGMTIKQLAEEVEKHTGKPMSRQNMTQRLGRDNFQEQDMRMIADILGCDFILSLVESSEKHTEDIISSTRDITIGDLVGINETIVEVPAGESVQDTFTKDAMEELLDKSSTDGTNENEEVSTASEIVSEQQDTREKEILRQGIKGYFRKTSSDTSSVSASAKTGVQGEINPYTRKEYETNSVRMHPKKIGYVQVYDREQHKWTDMTEWAFLGYQERKKQLLGKDYKPPIYLD